MQGSTTAGEVRRRKTKATTQTTRVRWLVGAAGLLVFVLGVGLGFAGSPDRLADGVTIAGVDVGGMTASDARALLAQRAEAQANVPVTFVAGVERLADQAQRARRGGELERRRRRRTGEGRWHEPRPRLPAHRAPPLPGRRRAFRARLQQRGRLQGQPARGRRRPAAPRRAARAARRLVPARRRAGRAQARPGRRGQARDRGARRLVAGEGRAARPDRSAAGDRRAAPARARPRDARRVGAGHAQDRHRELRRRAEAACGDAAPAERRLGRSRASAAPPRTPTSASSTAT